MNDYFKLMLAAKKANKPSFTYKGPKYVRKLHSIRPGVTPIAIYKKA